MLIDLGIWNPGSCLADLTRAALVIEARGQKIVELEAELEREVTTEYSLDRAISLAQLWRAGKLIGGDVDGVRDALLAEVERARGICGGCGTTLEKCSSYWPDQKKCCPDCDHHMRSPIARQSVPSS